MSIRKEAVEGYRRLLGSQHEDTLVAVGQLGKLLYKMGDHAAAAPLLQEAVQGLSALSADEANMQQLEDFKVLVKENAECLADPVQAAELQEVINEQRSVWEVKLAKLRKEQAWQRRWRLPDAVVAFLESPESILPVALTVVAVAVLVWRVGFVWVLIGSWALFVVMVFCWHVWCMFSEE